MESDLRHKVSLSVKIDIYIHIYGKKKTGKIKLSLPISNYKPMDLISNQADLDLTIFFMGVILQI